MNSAMISLDLEPAQLLAAVERELKRADRDRQRREAEPVEFEAEILLGLVHEDDQPEHGDGAERQVDEEHPVPGIGLGQPGAERGPMIGPIITPMPQIDIALARSWSV